MFSKKNRLEKKKVEQIFKQGKFVSSPNLTFKYIAVSPLSHPNKPKISFISPKTTSKKSVDRNLLRRRGYAALKKHIDQLPSNIMGVFIFSKKSQQVFGGNKNNKNNPFLNLSKEIQVILKKL